MAINAQGTKFRRHNSTEATALATTYATSYEFVAATSSLNSTAAVDFAAAGYTTNMYLNVVSNGVDKGIYRIKTVAATILTLFDAVGNEDLATNTTITGYSFADVGNVRGFNRVNHRMHKKLMVVDNAVAIVGGRNMSDPYFGVNATQNFRDLDVVAVGPVVRELSKVYDRFWNGDWAVPVAELVDRPYGMDDYTV